MWALNDKIVQGKIMHDQMMPKHQLQQAPPPPALTFSNPSASEMSFATTGSTTATTSDGLTYTSSNANWHVFDNDYKLHIKNKDE